jgi:hypothetical protein
VHPNTTRPWSLFLFVMIWLFDREFYVRLWWPLDRPFWRNEVRILGRRKRSEFASVAVGVKKSVASSAKPWADDDRPSRITRQRLLHRRLVVPYLAYQEAAIEGTNREMTTSILVTRRVRTTDRPHKALAPERLERECIEPSRKSRPNMIPSVFRRLHQL